MKQSQLGCEFCNLIRIDESVSTRIEAAEDRLDVESHVVATGGTDAPREVVDVLDAVECGLDGRSVGEIPLHQLDALIGQRL